MGDLQIVLASKNVEAQYVEMMVPLYSYGCERKMKKALSHLKGIYSVNADYYQQKVTVWGICNKDDLLETIRSKRKAARFWTQEDDHRLVKCSKPDDLSAEPNAKSILSSRPSFNLAKARSLGWKAWKKVFDRSNSF